MGANLLAYGKKVVGAYGDNVKIYKKEISNVAINQAWGSMYTTLDISVPVDTDLREKCVDVTFIRNGGSTALIFIGNITVDSVNVILYRPSTTGTATGTVYVIVYSEED